MNEVKDNITIEDVIKKQKENYKHFNESLIRKAYEYAKLHHGNQVRKSGEPYDSSC